MKPLSALYVFIFSAFCYSGDKINDNNEQVLSSLYNLRSEINQNQIEKKSKILDRLESIEVLYVGMKPFLEIASYQTENEGPVSYQNHIFVIRKYSLNLLQLLKFLGEDLSCSIPGKLEAIPESRIILKYRQLLKIVFENISDFFELGKDSYFPVTENIWIKVDAGYLRLQKLYKNLEDSRLKLPYFDFRLKGMLKTYNDISSRLGDKQREGTSGLEKRLLTMAYLDFITSWPEILWETDLDSENQDPIFFPIHTCIELTIDWINLANELE